MPSRARAGLVITLIVICSLVAGAAIERLTAQKWRHRGPLGGAHPSAENDARRRTEMLDRMTKDLSLSPVQRNGLDSIMRRTDSLLLVIRTEMRPRLTKVFDESRAEIRSRLDSAQRVQFEKNSTRDEGRGGRSGHRGNP